QPRLVLSGHGPLATGRQGTGSQMVRPGRPRDGEKPAMERRTPRRTSPVPRRSRRVVGLQGPTNCERTGKTSSRVAKPLMAVTSECPYGLPELADGQKISIQCVKSAVLQPTAQRNWGPGQLSFVIRHGPCAQVIGWDGSLFPMTR